MKLFQQLLVAGASVSLIAPIADQASDVVNIEEMNSYARSQSKSSKIDSKTFINEVSEDLAILKGRVDGLEAQQNNLEAGAFSQTTSMDGKAVFTVGAVDYSLASETASEATQAMYTYNMNLNSRFIVSDACAAKGEIKPTAVLATNNFWKSFILPHTKVTQKNWVTILYRA